MAKTYNLDYKPGEDALQYYRRLAKVADQRLVRLENLTQTEGFENVTAYAYARAQHDISRYTEGGMRFNTKPPLNSDGTVNNQMLNEKIADIKTFLSSVSSTKTGIVATYEKRAKTINAKYGTDYTWQDFADYFQSGSYTRHKKDFGSETIFKALGVIEHAGYKVAKEIRENKKKNISNEVAKQAALKMLSKKSSLWDRYSKEERAAIRKEIKNSIK